MKNDKLSRRTFGLGTVAAGLTMLGGPLARAQARRFDGRQIVSHIFSSGRDYLQSAAGEWLTQTTGATLGLVPALDAVGFSRLQAEAKNPTIDLFVSLSGNEKRAKALGLTRAIDLPDNAKGLQKELIDPDRHWLTWAVLASGLLYRTDKFSKAPTAYADIMDPKLAPHIAFPAAVNAYGIDFLVMMARAHGGSEKNIGPGFDALKKLRDGGATIIRGNPAEIQQQFAQNDIWIIPYDFASAYQTKKMGLPVSFAIPKEGSPALSCASYLAGMSKNADIATVLFDRLLSTEFQAGLAENLGWIPVNPNAKVSSELQALVPAQNQLLFLDRDTINESRNGWAERFKKEIAS